MRIGVRHPRIVQTSQGMTAGSFGTREFFHGAHAESSRDRRLRWAAALVFGFVAAGPDCSSLVLTAGSWPAALTARGFGCCCIAQ